MKALITGASSGIGKEISLQLASLGHDVILVARRENLLIDLSKKIKEKYNVDAKYVVCDLSKLDALDNLVNETQDIDIFINNAGFGQTGEFDEVDIKKDLSIVDLNIKSMQYLLKKYYEIFVRKNSGYIMNVASIAAYLPGPRMATYYASKSYVLSLSEAIYYEALKNKYNVVVNCLCPGPTESEFNDVAQAKSAVKKQSVSVVAKKAIKGMFKKKMVTIPSFKLRLIVLFKGFLSTKFLMGFIYRSKK